jgi:serine/threonine-protein kinase RsbT
MYFNEVSDYQPDPVSTAQLGTAGVAQGLKSPLSEVRVEISVLDDIIVARRRGRELAAQLGFSTCDLTLVATSISEIARNAIEYANGGEVVITPLIEGKRKGLKIVVSDRGPGIADISRAMRDGYSTGDGLGIGLPGARRLVDDFDITSEVGKGTVVTMKKWVA